MTFKLKKKSFSNTWEKLSFLYMKILMKQYTEDMDQKLTGNKGPLVYAGIKSIVKSSLGKNVPTLISSIVCLQNDEHMGLSLKIIERGYLKIQKQSISVCVLIYVS